MKKTISALAAAAMLICFILYASAVLSGDANGDGVLDNKDVITLFRFVSGAAKGCVEENCDVNGDNEIDNKDVVTLFRRLSEIPDTGTDSQHMSNDESENEDSGSFGDLFK